MQKRLLQLIRDNANRQASQLKAEVNGDGTVTIYLYDIIDSWFGASAEDMVKALQQHQDKTVHLRINSPGGDVFEARAMATAIAQHGNVHAHIDGLAASAATYVAISSKSVDIVEGGFFMIHNAWTFTYGNKDDLRSMADLLEKIDGTIVNDYAKKTGKASDDIATMMDEETWLTGAEALEHGFVDSVSDEAESDDGAKQDKWNLSAYAKAPKALTEPAAPAAPAPEQQQLQANKNRLRLLTVA